MIASQLYVLNKLNAARKWKKGKISCLRDLNLYPNASLIAW